MSDEQIWEDGMSIDEILASEGIDGLRDRFDAQIASIHDMLEDCKLASEDCKLASDNAFKKSAGPVADVMFLDRRIAIYFLGSADPHLRWVAIRIIKDRWGVNSDTIDWCWEAIKIEDDDMVRAEIITCLAEYYKEADQSAVGRLCAEIVYNCSYRTELRTIAYDCLLFLGDAPIGDLFPPKAIFPEYVDWRLVDSFLTSRGREDGHV